MTVSETCETWIEGVPCGKPAEWAYPTMGGGYHAMCEAHTAKHLAYRVTIEAARRGEKPTYSKKDSTP